MTLTNITLSPSAQQYYSSTFTYPTIEDGTEVVICGPFRSWYHGDTYHGSIGKIVSKNTHYLDNYNIYLYKPHKKVIVAHITEFAWCPLKITKRTWIDRGIECFGDIVSTCVTFLDRLKRRVLQTFKKNSPR